MSKPSLESVVKSFTAWNTAEHTRLHAPGNSAMTALAETRQRTALPYDHDQNMPVLKTMQHIGRLKFKYDNLQNADLDEDYTGRMVSDCLKLMAGQQVKRAVAVAHNQNHFKNLLLLGRMNKARLIQEAYEAAPNCLDISGLGSELSLAKDSITTSLQTINERAITGEDWGCKTSPMVEATIAGEIACARVGIAVITALSGMSRGVHSVPLRHPAADNEISRFAYPFQA